MSTDAPVLADFSQSHNNNNQYHNHNHNHDHDLNLSHYHGHSPNHSLNLNLSHSAGGSGEEEGDSPWGDNSSDYFYDYEWSVSSLPVEELAVNALGYGLVLLLGLVGNALVVVSVARYRRMHNVTNIFLLSLATADLLLVCICIPVKVSVEELGGSPHLPCPPRRLHLHPRQGEC